MYSLHPGMSVQELKCITDMRLRGENIYVQVSPDLLTSMQNPLRSTLVDFGASTSMGASSIGIANSKSVSSDSESCPSSSIKSNSETESKSESNTFSFSNPQFYDSDDFSCRYSSSSDSCNNMEEISSNSTPSISDSM